jgi:hypothetical protein
VTGAFLFAIGAYVLLLLLAAHGFRAFPTRRSAERRDLVIGFTRPALSDAPSSDCFYPLANAHKQECGPTGRCQFGVAARLESALRGT